MNDRHSCKKFTKILPVNNWKNIAKLLTISIFITAFGVASPKAAYAFLSSVDGCLAKPDCAAALGFELAPVVSNVVKGTVVVTGVCSLSSEPCSIPRYYWNAELNQQAQELAKQKYCTANSNEPVCSPPFTGGQSDRILYNISYDNDRHYYGTVSHYGGSYSTYDQPYDKFTATTQVYGPIKGIRVNGYPGEVGSPGIPGGGYNVEVYSDGWPFGNNPSGPQQPGWYFVGNGGSPPFYDFISNFKVLGRADGQTDTGGNLPPLAWKDWPQEKRDEAVKIVSPSDWQVILKYMPKGEDLKPGDIIKGLITIVVQATKDNPTTTKDESLQPKTMPGLYKVPPAASDSDVYSRLNPAQQKRVDDLTKEGRLTRKQVDTKGRIEPSNSCLYVPLIGHLGGNNDHDDYATYVTGSLNDLLLIEPKKGNYAFYDGQAQPGSAAARVGFLYAMTEVKTLHLWLNKFILEQPPAYFRRNPKLFYDGSAKTNDQVAGYNGLREQLDIYANVAKDCNVRFFTSFREETSGLAGRELFEFSRTRDRELSVSVSVRYIPLR